MILLIEQSIAWLMNFINSSRVHITNVRSWIRMDISDDGLFSGGKRLRVETNAGMDELEFWR